MSGASIIKHGIIQNLRSIAQQSQPCGVDLSLRRVLTWTSPATVDFANRFRQAASTSELKRSFSPSSSRGAGDSSKDADTGTDSDTQAFRLPQGAYLVEFNETCRIPLDYMGQIFVRSSLWRSGALLTAGVVDAGYEGALGALLDVRNPAGIVLHKDAKLGQMVLHKMQEEVAGYRGSYQNRNSVGGTHEN